MKRSLLAIVFYLLVTGNVDAAEKDMRLVDELGKDYNECGKFFAHEKHKCPESWSMKCYDYLISLNHKTQDCPQ